MTGDAVENKDPQIALVLVKLSALAREMDLRFTAVDNAQKINTLETQRRLEELNHAHANAVIDKEKFLPRETFDVFLLETRAATEKARQDARDAATKLSDTLAASDRRTDDTLDSINRRISNLEGRLAAYSVAIVIGMAVVQVMLKFIVK